MSKTEAIILSMTPRERESLDAITPSRKKRIADGSGTRLEDVNRLLKQFEQSQEMMRKLGNIDPNTGLPSHKNKNIQVNPNRKKERHKKKKKK